MKLAIILAILVILIGGCSTVQESPTVPIINTTPKISGTQELVLNEQDLQQLGMTRGGSEELHQLGWLSNGSDCKAEEYPTSESSPLAQYSLCSYIITSLNDTEVVIELKKFTNLEDLNGSYQYESQHLRSIEGLISENDYGDQSRFYVNNENDYGAQYNDPNVYYYALYISKDEYLIHITSKGRSKDAKESIADIGRRIMSKFG